jgi:hypothetical protein
MVEKRFVITAKESSLAEPDTRIMLKIEGITDVDLPVIRRIVDNAGFISRSHDVQENDNGSLNFRILLASTDNLAGFIQDIGGRVRDISNTNTAIQDAKRCSVALDADQSIAFGR